jgi:hypothetical protein
VRRGAGENRVGFVRSAGTVIGREITRSIFGTGRRR